MTRVLRGGLPAAFLLVLATAPTAAGAARPAATLPDTVLAQLNDGAHLERVSIADVQAAARRRGMAPESLTPSAARELLGTLLDRRALRLATASEPLAWTPQDSAQYRALGEQLAFEAALDSAFAVERAARAARGDTVTDPGVLGPSMRDAELARRAPAWNEPVVARMAAAFAALPAPDPADDLVTRARKKTRFPAVAAGDSDLVVVTHAGRPFTVRDLLDTWRALRTLDRPYLSQEQQVKDLVGTALYQRLLRERMRPATAPARAADAQRLRDRAEGFAAKAWAVRHAFSLVPRDSVTLQGVFDRDRSRYDVLANAEIVRRHLATRAAAEALAARLRMPAGADSLAALDRAQPERVPALVDERADAALVARCLAAGPLGVVGPDSLAAATWRVVLVLEAHPHRARTFSEARAAVDRAWFDSEGERLLREALDGLRRGYGEVVNEAAMSGMGRRP